MATIKYLLQSRNDNAPIYLRLSLGRGASLKRKTGLFVNPVEWSHVRGFAKQTKAHNKNLNANLRELETFVLNKLNEAVSKGELISGKWLEYIINLKFNRLKDNTTPEEVIYWIEYIIKNAHIFENSKGGYGLSYNRIKAYKGLLYTVKEFQGKTVLSIAELDKRMFESLKRWLFNEKKYSPATAIKKLTDLQKVVRVAREFVPIAKDFDSIKFKRVSSYDDDMDVITLTEEDIRKIEITELTSEALINARKWLILACFTGQRGDTLINRINEGNFESYGEDYIIKIKQKKGNKPITIPVLPKVKKIFEEGMPYKVTIQKLNFHFKTLCKIAGINEMVMGKKRDKNTGRNVKKLRPKYEYISTHTGRRTFATLHYKRLPTPVIMRITGHKKESTLLQYINRNHDDHVEIVLDYYKTKELRAKKSTLLNIIKSVS
ncbi:tyrosine-type recombinase/integrase [Aestuariivivens sediminicola]|uniref:tyrosine-type recombinase/integrase n=1 Tax=Aestuariivivens sediminicola TaxID=2913560 RepID=UPI001F5AD3E7|nr:phage integrase SAM-like domain-containing protein [Aestuariivivens sediminicola]